MQGINYDASLLLQHTRDLALNYNDLSLSLKRTHTPNTCLI